MRTVQAKRVKIGAPAKYAGIFVTCMMLASCSSSQNAFFTQRNALMSQGYTWQKLDRCRPAKEDALSIPVIGPDGRKLVCYILAPPQSDVAATATATTPAITPAPSSRRHLPRPQHQIPILGLRASSGIFQIFDRSGM